MNRFEPSLLDKLLSPIPHRAPSAAMRQLSLDELKATVARDVESLLNTRNVLTDEGLIALPQCRHSLLTYGLNDFAGLSLLSHEDRQFICNSIQQAIERHEPRLRRVAVKLALDKHSTNALYFAIQALLVVRKTEESVSFDAMLQPSTLRYSVTRAHKGEDQR